MGLLSEFREFAVKGNVVDLAVGVIIGGAFGKIVTSLTDDIIMPLIGKIFGGLDFSGYFMILGSVPADYKGSLTDYAALKKAGVALLGYGEFITQAVNFVIVAFIIFLMIRAVNRVMPKPVEEVAADPADVVLLREIRDELRAKRG